MSLRVLARDAARPLGRTLARRALCAASGSGSGGGILDRIRAVIPSMVHTRQTEKMVEMRAQGASWTEAAGAALRDMRQVKKEENIADYFETLATTDTYTIYNLRGHFAEALKAEDKMTMTQKMGLKFDRLRGGEQSEALEEMKKTVRLSLSIVDAMTPSERRNPLVLIKKQRPNRARIVTELGLGTDAPIKELMRQFEWTLIQWEFIKRESVAGRRIPASADELEWRLRQQPNSKGFKLLQEQSLRMMARMSRKSYPKPLGFAAERAAKRVDPRTRW